MGKVPKPRKPGQTGGMGGHGRNMHNAQKRDQSGGGGGCCFAGQAVKAVWMGKFRLAHRFARLDVKTRLGYL